MRFNDMPVGAFFTLPEGGLFFKVYLDDDKYDAVVVEPLATMSSVGVGELGGFSTASDLLPVDVTFYATIRRS